MTIYAQLLTIALDDSATDSGVSSSDLVLRAICHRSTLASAAGSEDRVAAALAYDVALACLCERLQIDHDLAGELAGPSARALTESLLVARLPSLAEAFPTDDTQREKE